MRPGADPENEIGEDHDPKSHLIPIVLDAVSGRRQTITVFGTDYDTPDGTCLRDYIHVSDLADAHVKALEALRSGAPSGAYNLGNGRGFSVREVISAAEKATGLKVPVVFGARRPGDPAQLISDATKAREALGWQPQIAGLSEILSTAWAWHQRKPSRSRAGARGSAVADVPEAPFCEAAGEDESYCAGRGNERSC